MFRCKSYDLSVYHSVEYQVESLLFCINKHEVIFSWTNFPWPDLCLAFLSFLLLLKHVLNTGDFRWSLFLSLSPFSPILTQWIMKRDRSDFYWLQIRCVFSKAWTGDVMNFWQFATLVLCFLQLMEFCILTLRFSHGFCNYDLTLWTS